MGRLARNLGVVCRFDRRISRRLPVFHPPARSDGLSAASCRRLLAAVVRIGGSFEYGAQPPALAACRLRLHRGPRRMEAFGGTLRPDCTVGGSRRCIHPPDTRTPPVRPRVRRTVGRRRLAHRRPVGTKAGHTAARIRRMADAARTSRLRPPPPPLRPHQPDSGRVQAAASRARRPAGVGLLLFAGLRRPDGRRPADGAHSR